MVHRATTLEARDVTRRHGLPLTTPLRWLEYGLVVEVDGFAFHRTRAAFERDRRRDAELQAHGLRVMRTTCRQITSEPEALVARLAQALARPP